MNDKNYSYIIINHYNHSIQLQLNRIVLWLCTICTYLKSDLKCILLSAPEHGLCNVPGQCICDEGYGGNTCEKDLDVCGHQQPCASGAVCTNLGPDKYLCSCAAGSTGKNCDTDINECSPNPCLNGANCYVSNTIHFRSEYIVYATL